MNQKTSLLAIVGAIALGNTAAILLKTQQYYGKAYKSGEVRTHEAFKYGKFITKLKAENKPGTVTSFFTFWKGAETGSSDEEWSPAGWSEIDMELVPSARYGTYSTNIIYEDEQMNSHQIGRKIANPEDDWAYYEIQWTPDYISWLYNGVEVRRVANTEEVHFLRQRTQHLMMNFWIPEGIADWSDGFDASDMPWYARYDFVEFWEYVPPEEYHLHDLANADHPFTFGWRDDFDTFDHSRWAKTDNWAFMQSIFMESQAYVEDGSLVLKCEPTYV